MGAYTNCDSKVLQLKLGTETLLFGGPSATHSLMEQNLIDGYWLFVNPVILGQGIPPFVDVKARIKLNLIRIRALASGVTELSDIMNR